jgi:hypothetical protein
MPVQIYDRSDPNRNRSQAKWFEQLREDHMRLEPGHPGLPLKTDAQRAAAGAHEIKLTGLVQLCRNCRRGTRESTWVVRCGPCGERFSPVLWIATGCEHCGWVDGAMERLSEHLERIH